MIILKSKEELLLMREAGRLVTRAHALIQEYLKPGIKTKELDELAASFIEKNKAQSTFLGYRGFPAHICIAINEEVVHGIPGERRLSNGDIIGIDIGVRLNGYCGDRAVTYSVGKVISRARELLKVTEEALDKGIEKAVVGNRLSDISHAIQSHVEGRGFSVVRDYVGHGIGQEMHEDPQLPHFGSPGRGPRLKKGMVLAIEPMVNVGDFRVKVKGDNWTVVTSDGSLSAQFEHTVAITEKGPWILTTL
ncbi:MAG TPA: type I methionyl aminopeptidase [bacterium]|nr:type I methionyl aminopeptidase [bacterium]